jgi:hypothetical protein
LGPRASSGPRVGLAVHRVRRLEQLQEGLRPGDLVEQRHPLLVLDAVGLHLPHGHPPRGVLLGHQHLARRLEHGLDDADDVEGVGLGLRVEDLEGREGEVCERLVEGEVLGQVDGEDVAAAVLVGLVEAGDGAGADERAGQPQRPARQPQLLTTGLVVLGEQPAQHRERVLGAGQDVDEHRVVHAHPRGQLLGRARDQLVEGLLAPDHRALGWLLELGLGLLLRQFL